MGKTELEIIKYIIGWFFRWLVSNEKNREKKREMQSKKEV